MKHKISIYFSITAILISIIAICIAAYRTPQLGFDYIGLLVGILATLVTALIGWQIFTTIGVEKKVDNMVKKLNNMNSHLEEEKEKIEIKLRGEEKERISNEHFFSGVFNFIQANFLKVNALQTNDNKRYLKVYEYYIFTIDCLLKSNNKNIVSFIEATISNMRTYIESGKNDTYYDNNDVDIDNLNKEIDEMIISKSPHFTSDQRREFMRLDTIYRKRWVKPKEE